MTRKIAGIYREAGFHWVGDGFRVANYIPGSAGIAERLSPFVLFDYHAPYAYAPAGSKRRGVGAHPHRGFETVTIAFEGSVAHHDSAGHAGVIGPGDVQWMTAGSGLLHKEYHADAFARAGGTMHMAQIWVNLPKAHKMHAPQYQAIEAAQMGRVTLPDGAGEVRIIAGELNGVKGPAHTFTPVNMYEIRLKPKGRLEMSFPAHENTALMTLDGDVTINGAQQARALDLVLFANEGEKIAVEAGAGAHLLLLNGEPINEPVVQHGPFVMNSAAEIRQAIIDFNNGAFGHLAD